MTGDGRLSGVSQWDSVTVGDRELMGVRSKQSIGRLLKARWLNVMTLGMKGSLLKARSAPLSLSTAPVRECSATIHHLSKLFPGKLKSSRGAVGEKSLGIVQDIYLLNKLFENLRR